ncbi:MAG: 30S ribosomal protein S4 [Chloroflexota bacterium]
MAKYIGPVCRLCRREGEKLYLKGGRCLSPKCAIERRPFAPGQHGKEGQVKRSRSSDYANQLREKQKARRIYGVLEAQFRRYYERAIRSSGLTGQVILQLLECRLDNVVYRLGFAENRAHARNLVTHGHFNVNGRRTDVPSMILQPGDVVEVRDGSRSRTYFKSLPDVSESRTVPGWINRDLARLSGKVLQAPNRQEIDSSLNEQLIVEYYSR